MEDFDALKVAIAAALERKLPPGAFAPMPQTFPELVGALLAHADHVSAAFNDLAHLACRAEDEGQDHAALLDQVHEITLRRFSDCSGLQLFIAAVNFGLLPPDPPGEPE